MEHSEAVTMQAVEKYLLHELSEPESKAFEEHFFACEACAAELESGTSFIANAREVFRDERPALEERVSEVPWWSFLTGSWGNLAVWAPSMAALALGVVVTYQSLVLLPGLSQRAELGNAARSLPTVQLTGVSRGEARVVAVPASAPFFAVAFDITADVPFSSYRCDLQDSSGRVQFQIPTDPPKPGQPANILVPTRGLAPGMYKLSLFGISGGAQSGTKIADYVFRLEIK